MFTLRNRHSKPILATLPLRDRIARIAPGLTLDFAKNRENLFLIAECQGDSKGFFITGFMSA
jgi:hypothetical protein